MKKRFNTIQTIIVSLVLSFAISPQTFAITGVITGVKKIKDIGDWRVATGYYQAGKNIKCVIITEAEKGDWISAKNKAWFVIGPVSNPDEPDYMELLFTPGFYTSSEGMTYSFDGTKKKINGNPYGFAHSDTIDYGSFFSLISIDLSNAKGGPGVYMFRASKTFEVYKATLYSKSSISVPVVFNTKGFREAYNEALSCNK